MMQVMNLILLLPLVSGSMLENPGNHYLSAIKPLLEKFLPGQATIVPLGDWTLRDYMLFCSPEFSFGCTNVDNFDTSLNSKGKRLQTVPLLHWKQGENAGNLLFKWSYASPRPPVGQDENKVFIMSSPDHVRLAEDICDTDFSRHCTGILITSNNEPPPTSFYMPLVTFNQKGNVTVISSMFSRCNITNEKFANFNTVTKRLYKKMDLARSVSCRRNTVKRTIRAHEVNRMLSDRKMEDAIKNKGKIGVGFYNEPLTLWNALVESLGWELNVSFPVPDIPSEGGGFLAINLTNFRPMMLLREGISDVVLYHPSHGISYNKHPYIPHPFLAPIRYIHIRKNLAFGCPLASKVSSFYNIVTPLTLNVWIGVFATLILVSMVGVILNQVYKTMPGMTIKWSWYEVPMIVYSILFAETFPAKWEAKGAGRRVFNEFWKFGAMFIVLFYLCNLRSHLIKTIKIPPPNSIEELALPRYTYKLLTSPFVLMPGMPAYLQSINKQGRFVLTLRAPATGKEALDFVKNEGGCVFAYDNDLIKQEWYNQRRLGTHYFHIILWTSYFITTYATWVVLKTDPYLPIYQLKFMHMEEAGVIKMMSDQWKSFKPMEAELLEPLKLQHFYITMIGIAVGILLAFVAFAVEKFLSAKNVKNNPVA